MMPSPHLRSAYQPVTSLELTAEEIQLPLQKRVSSFLSKRIKQADTMVMRIAVPPLAVWAVLYSIVEYMA